MRLHKNIIHAWNFTDFRIPPTFFYRLLLVLCLLTEKRDYDKRLSDLIIVNSRHENKTNSINFQFIIMLLPKLLHILRQALQLHVSTTSVCCNPDDEQKKYFLISNPEVSNILRLI